jgi:rubredoxin
MNEDLYCRECGCESGFAYLGTYAKGSEWRCPHCKAEFIWDDEFSKEDGHV